MVEHGVHWGYHGAAATHGGIHRLAPAAAAPAPGQPDWAGTAAATAIWNYYKNIKNTLLNIYFTNIFI